MSLLLHVRVFVLDNVVFNMCLEELVVPLMIGSLTVLSDHAPLVSVIGKGMIRLRFSAEWFSVPVIGGILEVEDNRVQLIIDGMSDIDMARWMDVWG
ncbi:ATP synthase CF1 epsilon subunit (plastid) [Cryptomonas paramecium]|uniref:ATP synthase CF1 epsilon subunit n=1 Tax=Cryptomonas paramaecium TaxID=2898 RepID=D2IS86_9CRYP|nr:ATP synthase CF1 epsilon subunit [Cryptomonas paramecium]ACT46778.1 ATP synthase CF1 epsilon subunit [Cryptomonas paramecium]BDA98017.1 ATP synthase CF1 epsilon subunit [Cryptomonas paramecium]